MPRHTLAALALLAGLAGAMPADAQRASTNGAGVVPKGWCKGNGNPHASECPIFAPGSTAPNTHTSNQPIQTTNQLPSIPQQPTLSSIPMTMLTSATAVPPQPLLQVPVQIGTAVPQPLPQAIPHMQQSSQQLPQESLQQPSPQQMAVPKQLPGYIFYPNTPTPRDARGYPLMTLPDRHGGQTPHLQPGYAAYPHYAGPRDPHTGYPVPVQPQMNVPSQRIGYIYYPHWTGPREPVTGMPLTTPPPAHGGATPHLPTGSVPKQLPGYIFYPNTPTPRDARGYPLMTLPDRHGGQTPHLRPGYAAYPHYTGPRDPNTGYPMPSQPPAQQTPQQLATAVPQPLPHDVPPLKPGFVAYPHYVGPRDPDTGYPVPPHPTMAVPHQQPQPIVAVPHQQPQPIVAVPPQPPILAPHLQPQPTVAVPPQPPTLAPRQQPQPMMVAPPLQPTLPPPLQQVAVTRPRPLPPQGNPPPTSQATVTITPQGNGTHVGADLISATSGRQAPTAIPVFEAKGTGDRWHCVASGHHIRKVFDDGGNEVYAGSLPGVAIQVVPIIRDVPAWHDLSSECIISVREHPKATQARR